jgi:hypothetical protein
MQQCVDSDEDVIALFFYPVPEEELTLFCACNSDLVPFHHHNKLDFFPSKQSVVWQ